MRGFIVGSVTLIVLETVLQPQSAKNIQGLAGLVQSTMRRALAADVAGVPNRVIPPRALGKVHKGSKTLRKATGDNTVAA